MASTEKVNVSNFVQKFVAAGIDEKSAKAKVAEIVARVDEVMPGAQVTEKNQVIAIMTDKAMKAMKATKYQVVVVAATPLADANGYNKKKALDMYGNETTRSAAIENGMIQIINGVPTPIDNKKFFDPEGTMKNPGYGKPYQVRMQSDALIIRDGVLEKVKGNFTLEPGFIYDIYGGISEKSGNLFVNKEPAPRKVRALASADFFNMVYEAAKQSDIAMDVSEAFESELKGFVLVKGTVQYVGTTSSGGAHITLSNDMGDGMPVFSVGEVVAKDMFEAFVGSDALVAGRFKDPSDPTKYKRSINAFGFVMNPKANGVAAAIDALADYEF